jgi:hypothetical protein
MIKVVPISVLIIIFLFTTQSASASSSVNIQNNVNTSVTQSSTSKNSTRVVVNGVEYVNENNESSKSYNSDINVNVEDKGNGPTGSVHINVNGEDKSYVVTPGSSKSVTPTKELENKNGTKDNKETEGQKRNKGKVSESFFEKLFKQMQDFFKNFSRFFSIKSSNN